LRTSWLLESAAPPGMGGGEHWGGVGAPRRSTTCSRGDTVGATLRAAASKHAVATAAFERHTERSEQTVPVHVVPGAWFECPAWFEVAKLGVKPRQRPA
jgi:hypothetical protein